MASPCDEVKAVLLDFAPIRRPPADPMPLRDPEAGLGYSEYGLSAVAPQLNQILSRHGGTADITRGDLKKCNVVADVCHLLEGRIR